MMIHGMPDRTVRYIACFLTAYSVVPILPFENETTKSEAQKTIREFAKTFPMNTRFCLKRVQTDYLEVVSSA